MLEQRCSEIDASKRDIPSFIEPRPPLISNPFMRPRPQKGTNLMELFEEDSVCDEPELVQVYLRMKPYDVPSNLYEIRSSHHLVTSLDKVSAGHGRRTQANVSKMYTFSHIFGPQSSQKEIFESVVKDNLKKLPDGHSFTLLTYGASGSGKTYTLMGTVQSPGLVPRSLEYLFRIVDAAQQPLFKPVDGNAEQLRYENQEYELQWVKCLRQVSAPLRDKYRRMSVQLVNDMTRSTFDLSGRIKHYVWVSFIEIYNEGIFDLLVTGDRRASSTLRIREDSDGNVFVKGATQAFVRSGAEAYDILVAGKHNLQVAATGIHDRSSRSHCIFTITMLTETEGGLRWSSVRLCDLAGCERALRTRNTGARLAESRHINTSLHVLERCLHTLRRRGKARGIVPYRESKLTRLLGAGLSGTRGESVSMVVTVTPAPQYAHETKHVLSLAAVARDIQINNTMVESTLESSTSDTTITCSAEVMKLRSENERLHFELLQSQARNKELMASMEEKQQENALTMRELVDEAKDMTRQYYESQLQALQTEMEEMMEEYESRLGNLAKPLSETPNRLQNRVAQLLTEVAILEEKLVAERLARERAEEEVQHLRACIDERDEKSEEDEEPIDEGVTSLSESEDSDICNEGLEPTFKKEDIDRSRQILRQSMMSDLNNTTLRTNRTLEVNDSVFGDKDVTYNENDKYTRQKDRVNFSIDKSGLDLAQESEIHYETVSNGTEMETNDNKYAPLTRGTYFVRNSEITISDDSNSSIEVPTTVKKGVPNRDTYYISDKDNSNDVSAVEKHLPEDSFDDKYVTNPKQHIIEPIKMSETLVSKIFKKVQSSGSIDNSLMQFEKLEIESKNYKDNSKESEDFIDNKRFLKDKKNYFDEPITTGDQQSQYKDTVDSSTEVVNKSNKVECNVTDTKVPSKPDNVKDVVNENCTSKTPIKSVTNDAKNTFLENILNISINSKEEKQPNNTVEVDNDKTKDIINESSIAVLKSIGKKTYFDNLDDNIPRDTNKDTRVNEIKDNLSDERSPSIVKDEITDKVELSTLKKLLGESYSRQTVNSINKVLAKTKKQESIDMFESPNINTVRDHIDNVRKSFDTQKLKVDKITIPEIKVTHEITKDDIKTEVSMNNTNVNNTVEDFENIYKDITEPRATEFDLLVSDISNTTTDIKEPKQANDTKYNLRKTQAKIESEEKDIETEKSTRTESRKYKLRNIHTEEVLEESQAKCETQTKPSKRNLRLRRRKNQDDEISDTSQDNSKDKQSDVNTQAKSKAKLKDIVNLQAEFSDVTMDVPAPVKEVKDIPSPEKGDENENVPPMGIQSCPSKSITRSRRKLFTPRAEPLDESTRENNSGEPIRVPRPSYKGPRVRRRL